jgi:hypothetical protein
VNEIVLFVEEAYLLCDYIDNCCQRGVLESWGESWVDFGVAGLASAVSDTFAAR